MKTVLVINCVHCKRNSPGRVEYQSYVIGVSFEQRILCLGCNGYNFVKLDLRKGGKPPP